MALANENRALRVEKPFREFAPQARHRLRHTAPGRDHAGIAETCFLAWRLPVDDGDGKPTFSKLQGAADADNAGANDDDIVSVPLALPCHRLFLPLLDPLSVRASACRPFSHQGHSPARFHSAGSGTARRR